VLPTNTSPTKTTRPYCFKRDERVKRRDDIRRVFKQGRVVSCPGAKLFVLKQMDNANETKQAKNRIAFTFSRKFGNAVQRNRARRLGREAYRYIRNDLKAGYDLVWLLYPGPDVLVERKKQLETLCSRAGLKR
jgi:ribonuclease P protein component